MDGIGERLRFLRQQKGMTLQQVAEEDFDSCSHIFSFLLKIILIIFYLCEYL